jgi:hypothetical protein
MCFPICPLEVRGCYSFTTRGSHRVVATWHTRHRRGQRITVNIFRISSSGASSPPLVPRLYNFSGFIVAPNRSLQVFILDFSLFFHIHKLFCNKISKNWIKWLGIFFSLKQAPLCFFSIFIFWGCWDENMQSSYTHRITNKNIYSNTNFEVETEQKKSKYQEPGAQIKPHLHTSFTSYGLKFWSVS